MYWGDGQYKSPTLIAPGKHGDANPYGTCPWVETFVPRAWVRSPDPGRFVPGWDYAAIKADCNIGLQTGVITLHRRSDAALLGNTSMAMGYPADLDGGKRMYRSVDQVRVVKPRKIFYSNSTLQGMSGGPVMRYCQSIQRWCAIGIATTARSRIRPWPANNYNGAVRFHTRAWRNLNHWARCIRDNLPFEEGTCRTGG